jgi:hypothetical protein
VVLVGELYLRDCSRGRRGVDQNGVVALDKAVPFKIERNALRISNHISIRCLGVFGLRVDNLHKLTHAMLHCLNNMRFKLSKRVLDTNEILAVIVLLLNLLVEPMHDTALQDIGIVCSLHIAAVRVKCRRVLAQELNVLLGVGAGLVNRLAAFTSSFGQLLALVLDLGVKAIENGKNCAFQLFGRLVVLVGDALSTVSVAALAASVFSSHLGVATNILE